MPTEKPRFCITVDEDLLAQIDEHRFAKRYTSRSKATVNLIRLGLEALRTQKAEKDKAQK